MLIISIRTVHSTEVCYLWTIYFTKAQYSNVGVPCWRSLHPSESGSRSISIASTLLFTSHYVENSIKADNNNSSNGKYYKTFVLNAESKPRFLVAEPVSRYRCSSMNYRVLWEQNTGFYKTGGQSAQNSAHLFSTLLTERLPPLALQLDLLNWTDKERHGWLQLKSKLASTEPPSFPGSNFRRALSGGCSHRKTRPLKTTPPGALTHYWFIFRTRLGGGIGYVEGGL